MHGLGKVLLFYLIILVQVDSTVADHQVDLISK
jgi:hypothetical protein